MRDKSHKARSDLAVLILHWSLVGTFLVCLLTGGHIAYDSQHTLAHTWAKWTDSWPEGMVVQWHLISALVLCALLAGYLGFMVWSGQWRRLTAPRRKSRSTLGWLANISSVLSVGLLVGLAVTGVAMYFGGASSLWPQWHGALASALIVATIAHVGIQAVAGRFSALWRIRWQRIAIGTASMAGAAFIAAAIWWIEPGADTQLIVAHQEADISLDGRADEAIWSELPTATVHTQYGANFDGGTTDVSIKGFHDAESIYLLVQWKDATSSDIHLPLERTANGWRLISQGIEHDDETGFYEDKIAIAWSEKPILASAFTHHGKALIDGPHRPTTRGLHYTADGSMLDMWHWKSIRTGHQLPPRMDDNHIGPPIESVLVGHRYTGGYQPDWGGTGYSLNICLRDDPDCQATLKYVAQSGEFESVPGSARQRLQACLTQEESCEERLIPILLPKPTSADSTQSGAGSLSPVSGQVWTDQAEQSVAIGERIPGVVVYGRLDLNRDDVRAVGHWQDGLWTLEIKRSLTTRDEKDINLQPDVSPRYLWVAPFDSAQTRHAHHMRPIAVRIEPANTGINIAKQ